MPCGTFAPVPPSWKLLYLVPTPPGPLRGCHVLWEPARPVTEHSPSKPALSFLSPPRPAHLRSGSSFPPSQELPEGGASSCLSVCPLEQSLCLRVPGEGCADAELGGDPLWADCTVTLPPPQPLPLVVVLAKWWRGAGRGSAKCGSGLTVSCSVALGMEGREEGPGG